jgi:hypothetical protein
MLVSNRSLRVAVIPWSVGNANLLSTTASDCQITCERPELRASDRESTESTCKRPKLRESDRGSACTSYGVSKLFRIHIALLYSKPWKQALRTGCASCCLVRATQSSRYKLRGSPTHNIWRTIVVRLSWNFFI